MASDRKSKLAEEALKFFLQVVERLLRLTAIVSSEDDPRFAMRTTSTGARPDFLQLLPK
jgi:hypothetical protein